VRAALARRAAAEISKPKGHGAVFGSRSKRGPALLPDFVHAEVASVPLMLTEKGERANRQNEIWSGSKRGQGFESYARVVSGHHPPRTLG
jgi:hypothetical protein